MSIMNKTQLNAAISRVAKTREKMQEEVHEALVSACFYAIGPDKNTTPLNQLLDAMGNSTHIKGATMWVELNFPIVIREGKFQVTKAGKQVDCPDTEAYAEWEIQARMGPKWFEIAGKQKRESMFSPDTYMDHVFAKLDKEGQKELAETMKKAFQVFKFNHATTE